MKHTLCFTLTAVISLLLIVAGTVLFGLPLLREIPSLSGMYVRAVVLSVEETADGTSGNTDTVFRALLKSGPDKGTTVTARQNADKSISYETKAVAKNDTVILSSPEESGLDGWYFVEYVRSDYLIVLAVVFFAALLLFGRMKGLKSALSLLYTVAAIFLVFIPAVLTGQSIYLWTAILGVFITAMTLLLVNGWTELTLSSVLGCLSGISLSAVLIVISEAILHMSGYVDESSIYLSFLVPDMKGILYAAIIIGAIGAIMDVAVNIAAALHELALKTEQPTFSSLLASGFTIGRDILGTMTNTLILAYVGGSMCSVLLVLYYNASSPLQLFNRELIVSEVLQILIGSLALLLTIPASAAISALLFSRPSFQLKKRAEAAEETRDDFTDELNSMSGGSDETL
ncbi:MAG: YibE/F family protein [Clostridia bacterium]|nr:YibE/F family protein [Clostridia bacterium]